MSIGSKIIFISNLTSTNTHAIRLAAVEKPPEGTIVRTDFQTAGRGQPGNIWESEEGKNLLFSIILYPEEILPGDQFMVSMVVSLGLHDYLSSIIPRCSIKWPNDMYIRDDKIAGILIESSIMGSRIDYMIAGIGLNVNQEKFTGGAPNPISIKLLTGQDYNVSSCLADLAVFLDRRYTELKPDSYPRIREEYLSKLYRFNKWSEFRDSKGIFTGMITDVENTGRMIINDKKGNKRKYYFKEVDFIL